MDENEDLLNLCQINLIEENIEDSVAPDADAMKSAIDYKKRMLITKMKHNPSPISDDAMHRLRINNTYWKNYFNNLILKLTYNKRGIMNITSVTSCSIPEVLCRPV